MEQHPLWQVKMRDQQKKAQAIKEEAERKYQMERDAEDLAEARRVHQFLVNYAGMPGDAPVLAIGDRACIEGLEFFVDQEDGVLCVVRGNARPIAIVHVLLDGLGAYKPNTHHQPKHGIYHGEVGEEDIANIPAWTADAIDAVNKVYENNLRVAKEIEKNKAEKEGVVKFGDIVTLNQEAAERLKSALERAARSLVSVEFDAISAAFRKTSDDGNWILKDQIDFRAKLLDDISAILRSL